MANETVTVNQSTNSVTVNQSTNTASIVATNSGAALGSGGDIDGNLTITPTWNIGGNEFTSLLVNATDTASAATSELLDLQLSGSSKFIVLKTGNATLTGQLAAASLDISGNVDVDGTLETDALTINGTASNAFTSALLSKLNAIEASATADQTAAEIRTLVESASDSNVFTDADHTKLNAIEASADVTDTANVVAALSAGSNISIGTDGTIAATDTNTQLSNEQVQDIVGGMLTGNTESGITVTYEDGDGTIDFAVASQTDENFTTADHAKLDNIEANATADQTAAEIRTLVEAASDSNVFTDADHNKLNNIEAAADVTDTTNVVAALSAGSNISIGTDGTIAATDTNTQLSDEQVQDIVGGMLSGNTESGVTVTYQDADGTIDFAVSSQTDENFTTADHAKLDGIEALADVTDTTNVVAALSAGSNISIGTDGTIAATDTNTQLSNEQVQDIIGGMLSGNTESGITVTYEDSDGTIDFAVASQTDENFTTADHAKLDGIEAGADVTPTWVPDADPSYATQSFVTTQVSNLVDSAPGALDTLNELAAAIGDDANFSTTVTNSIATKLPLAGGTMTGNIVMSGSQTVDGRDVSADGTKLDGIEASADVTDTANVVAALSAGSNISIGTDGTISSTDTNTQLTTEQVQDIVGGMLSGNTESGITVSYEDGDGTIDFAVASQTDENFTTADHSKLDGIESGATADQTASEIRTLVDSATDSNVFTDADHTKLDGIEASADVTDTANVVAALSAGSNISIGTDGTIASTDTNTQLSNEQVQDIVGGMLSGNTESGITVAYQDADGTIDFTVASQTDENFTTADHTKLDGIEASADVTDTANVVAALSAGSNISIGSDGTIAATDTNTQLSNEQVQDIVGGMVSSNTESGITVSYQDGDGTLDFAVASQTDENFTTADHAKLDGIESGATADQTASEIKTLYESNSDTNAFTDALQTKLSGVEASADVTDTANVVAALSAGSNISIGSDGTIAATDTNTQLSNEQVQDIVGGMLSGNTESGITVSYQDGDGTIDFSVASQTDENFTTADHSKLDGIEANATADQTASEIRTLVDAATDSNVFTDDDHSKLNAIEASADVTDTANVVAALSAGSNISIGTDGTISSTDTNTQLSNEQVQDIVGGMVSSNTESGITVSYQDGDGTLDFAVASQTDENFTTADHAKLDGIEAGADVTPSWVPDSDPSYATQSFVNTQVSNLVDSAPAALDTLNELAAAIGDDASFSTTITNSIAAKLPLAGGTMSGGLNMGGNAITNVGNVDGRDVSSDGSKLDGIEASADVTDTANVVAALSAGSNISIGTDGTISSTDTNTQLSNEQVQDIVGGMVSSNTESGITVTYQDGDGTIDFAVASQTDENFTTADHAKLDGIESGATGDQTASEIRTLYLSNSNTNNFNDASSTKLDGIEASADVTDTANVVAALSAGSNIAIGTDGTISSTDTNTQLSDEQVQDIVGAMVSSNSESGITVTYQDADGTIDFAVASQTDQNFTNADHSKLDGIESGATADQTASEIRALVESASDSNVFTDADHSKLNAIEASADVTDTANVVAALSAGSNISIGSDGTIAATDTNTQLSNEQVQDIVGGMVSSNTESGITVTYQDGDGTLDFSVASQTDENFTTADHSKLDGIESGATADQTASEIRALVESASDSHVFTDADHTKLNNIEASADVTDTANVVAALSAGSNISIGSDGTITATDTNTQLSSEQVQDIVGAMVSSNTESGITVTYQDGDGTLDFSVASQTDQNFTNADHSKLDGIEASADVTDATNVAAAGALMLNTGGTISANTKFTDGTSLGVGSGFDIKLSHDGTDSFIENANGDLYFTQNADSKSIEFQCDNGSGGVTQYLKLRGNVEDILLSKPLTTTSTIDGRDVATDGTKLDGIESGATADQTAAEIRTLVESASDSNVFTDADHSKLNAIEASADVTDTANVVAALTAGSNISIGSDGTITATDTNTQLSTEQVQDIVGGMVSSNTETGVTVTYQDGDGTLDFSVTPSSIGLGNVTNESKATMFSSAALTGNPTAPTQSAGNDSTRIATTAFVSTAVSNLVDAAPGALDTLNELAAAIGDDANFSTTITNSIATKLPLAGGTLTGNLILNQGLFAQFGSKMRINQVTDGNSVISALTDDLVIQNSDSSGRDIFLRAYDGSSGVTNYLTINGGTQTIDLAQNLTTTGTIDGRDVASDGSKLDGIESGATADQTASEIRALVESASDSNVFTDADHTKLNNIEASATADQTASEILTLVKTVDGAEHFCDHIIV